MQKALNTTFAFACQVLPNIDERELRQLAQRLEVEGHTREQLVEGVLTALGLPLKPILFQPIAIDPSAVAVLFTLASLPVALMVWAVIAVASPEIALTALFPTLLPGLLATVAGASWVVEHNNKVARTAPRSLQVKARRIFKLRALPVSDVRLRCPLCREWIGVGPASTCATCAARVHPDCLDEFGRGCCDPRLQVAQRA